MRVGVAVGVGAVGVVGALLAVLMVTWTTRPPPALDASVDSPAASRDSTATRGSRGAGPTSRGPAGATDGAAADGSPELEGVELAPELLALDPDFETALSKTMTLADLPAQGTAQELDRAVTEQLLELVSTVQTAADAHVAYAETAPRAQAKIARGRAAQLYQHLADQIRDAPLAPQLPADQAALHRATRERMADRHARQAALLRSQTP
jgi:hypothetical protein